MRTVNAQRIRMLQVLRAIAATSVVYWHTSCWPNFGSFGVDLFFVLSGFVISMVAATASSPSEFALGRLVRVVPLYWILTTLLLFIAIIKPDLLNSTTADFVDYIRSIFFIPFYKHDGDKWPATMLVVGWTLNYEMLFYAVAFVALLTVRPRFFIYAASLLLIALWAIAYSWPERSALFGFLKSTLLFEFVMGMIAYHFWHATMIAKVPMRFLIVSVVVLYVFMAEAESIGYGNRLYVFGIPAFFLVLFSTRLESMLDSINVSIVDLLVHLGDASYATYLSHIFVVQFIGKVLYPRFDFLALDLPLGAFVAVIASLMVGSIVYWCVDRPSTKIARELANKCRRFCRVKLFRAAGRML